ncbi:MAG: ATP synthase F1 subunit epsilon [Pseudomonadota bacterium]|nr:ATP synthase F1 subunit epsilon [Pseudomonadota bacterium]MEC8461190.1 ATP synthase F1 subunit epsilon [Pseudomonadota bacterium]
MKTFQFRFVALSSVIYEGTIVSVSFPGVSGDVEIYADHAPAMFLLRPGAIKVSLSDGSQRLFCVERGLVQVLKNSVVALVNRAINSGEIDIDVLSKRSKELRELTQTQLSSKTKEKIFRRLSYLEEQSKIAKRIQAEK